MQIRILTYNMHKGFCFYSRQYVLRELREAIRQVNADIVFLQEVMGVHPEEIKGNHIDSQFEYLADSIWPHFAYGKNAVYSSGHHGNSILSKYPIVEYENINVSTNPFERRGLLHAQVKLEGNEKNLHLVCLHLDLLKRGRDRQLTSLIERIQQTVPTESPLIVAGDFNDWQKKLSDPLFESAGLRECGIELRGEHPKTFPSWRPFLSLDRVYVRQLKPHHHEVLAGLPWSKMSDHAAVVVDLEIGS
ncbi:MAG: endonuclease/exonuclease/phosphatase family protein [Bdellovibrionales bacterium]